MTEMTITEHPTLAAALAAFQAEVPSIRKGNTATVASQKGSYQYAYADLSDVTEKALPLLGKHGLSFTSKPTLVFAAGGEQTFVMEYALRHSASDEAIDGIYPLPDPQAVSPQALGSALTYARRYCLCAVTGVAPGGDDDDAHAQGDQPAQSRRAPRPPRRDPGRATPDEPIDPPKPSKDWAGMALQAESYEQLKAVHAEADSLGELGLVISGDGETVGQMLRRRKAFLEEKAAKEAVPVPSRVPVDFVSEARAAQTRDELRAVLEAAASAGVSREVLAEIAAFEDSLPAEEIDWRAAVSESDGEARH